MADVPLILILSTPFAIVLLGIIAAYLHHRRQMEKIKQGMVSTENDSGSGDIWWILAVGLVLTGVGAGRMLESHLQAKPIDSIPVVFIGIACILYFTVKNIYLSRMSQ